MSDKILQALMQLFAIIANSGQVSVHGRNIVQSFLKQQISQSHIEHYLNVFDNFLTVLQGKKEAGREQKRVSVNSVKVLRICTDINSELDLKQKYIVLVRLIEFVFSGKEASDQEMEFLSTVANVFNISESEFRNCQQLCTVTSANISGEGFLSINTSDEASSSEQKDLLLLSHSQPSLLFARYFGSDQITINGQTVVSDAVFVFSPGAVLRGTRSRTVYYSDVLKSFRTETVSESIVLQAKEVQYIFPGGNTGMHPISFSAASGNLVGIMGGSGAGKSTLLNILNGNIIPASGQVLVNGTDLHKESKKLQGIIGYVPQDDLLIEELTVFQNLFYNSKLCFGNLSDQEIGARIQALLESLGLEAIRDLTVGDVFNKTISGGQRKRLNIALELIRKPSVLFVDEPTSGLSSLDSENVMDLLKQLALDGNLVFVVIHQPSSAIYKLFDRLLLLDTGGYHIYYGNPLDALIYFKTKADYADRESECSTCGNVNPEQLFSIIETKVLDEYGMLTHERKIQPAEWYAAFRDRKDAATVSPESRSMPEVAFKKPSRLSQMLIYLKRDVLSKLNNTQYLMINFLQAPVLAFIIAYFLRYHEAGSPYVFRDNGNLPAYIFMSVIVALFMGLTVSAEEIIHDRKILKRELFLNLSRSSYLFSKMTVVFLISAIQTLTFVIVGNLVFGIQDMVTDYAIMLFAVSCFANVLGLNISAAFDSVVTIYILIPFLIIPQIILSGVIVKYESLNPDVTSQKKVPLIGEIMAARWAFEAMAVNQFRNNAYEKNFFLVDKELSEATWKKDFWMHKVSDRLHSFKATGNKSDMEFAISELAKEAESNNAVPYTHQIPIKPDDGLNYLKNLRKYYISEFNNASARKDSIMNVITANDESVATRMMNEYTNESLSDMVLNSNELDPVTEYNGEIIRKFRPVYMDGPLHSFVRSQFFVSGKNIAGTYYNTYGVNLIIIWLMTLVLTITLYFNVLRKIMRAVPAFFRQLKKVRKSA